MSNINKARILCVDDEPRILEGLSSTLRKHFHVTTATSGEAGLERIAHDEPFAVVLSDMRMPQMNGAVFLAQVRERSPESVRVLLTGQADLDSAIAAVNQGQLFRFLTKPCAPDLLIGALRAAEQQHQLITSERVLLEQTLRGAIKAMTNVLAMTSPTAFGRANRVKAHVQRLAERLAVSERWQLEVAALVSQIGCITLPPQTAEKYYRGAPLSHEEQQMVDRLPAIAGEFLASIPRLEEVCRILRHQNDPPTASATPLGSRILKLAIEQDLAEARGLSPDEASAQLGARRSEFDAAVLAAWLDTAGGVRPSTEMRRVKPDELRVGMVFAEDVHSNVGAVLVARGQEVTPSLLARIRNFGAGVGIGALNVIVESPARAACLATVG